jgi:hypothetical protein
MPHRGWANRGMLVLPAQFSAPHGTASTAVYRAEHCPCDGRHGTSTWPRRDLPAWPTHWLRRARSLCVAQPDSYRLCQCDYTHFCNFRSQSNPSHGVRVELSLLLDTCQLMADVPFPSVSVGWPSTTLGGLSTGKKDHITPK